MKLYKILLIFVALLVPVAFFAGCGGAAPEQTNTNGGGGGGGNEWTGPKIVIAVKLLPNATNLYDPVAGTNNDVYIVGSLAELKLASDTTKVLKNWDPADPTAKMTFVSNDVDGLPIYAIVLANDLTNGLSLQFKFVNGTPGFGSSWANVEKTADGGEVNNRSATIDPGVDVLVTNLGTNVVTGSGVDVAPNGIQKWANVGPTYSVTNVNITIVITNVATNKGSDIIGAFGFSGDFNGWGGPLEATILQTNANGTVDIQGVVSDYAGAASIGFKTRGSNETSGAWEWEADPNHSIALPPSFANGGSISVTQGFNGSW